MSKHKRTDDGRRNAGASSRLLSIMESGPLESEKVVGYQKRKLTFKRSHSFVLGGTIVILLLGVGIMAANGWLPSADPLSGKRTGWFGKEIPKNAPSSWNPLVDPTPSPTPQLSKENIYAGSRILSVVDANATEIPPTDLAVWRPGTGTGSSVWYVMGPNATIAASAAWGLGSDTPEPGDYDGDGKTDFCVFRASDSTWYIIYSSTGGEAGVQFGTTGDLPAPADYDGDGKTDVAVFRPDAVNGTWYYVRSSDQGLVNYQFGLKDDAPAPADYDGDGKADFAVWRTTNHTFYTVRSSDNTLEVVSFGSTGGQPVPGDYDGDGMANYAVRSGASWIIMNSSLSGTTTTTPTGDGATDLATDTPVPNDYDGDGKCDIAVWRDSNGDWYIRKSGNSNSLRQDHWGQSGDKPVPAYFRR